MPNILLTPKVYANAMLKLLKNNLVMGRLVTTKYNDKFKKVGQTIYVKRPPEFVIREGRVAQVQDVISGEVPVRLDKQRGIDVEFSSIEETLTVDQLLMDGIMNAKAAALAQEIDSDLMAATQEFPSWVGTPGETISTPAEFFAAPQRMDELAIPGDARSGVLSPTDYWATAAQFTTGNIYQNDPNMTALKKAMLPLMGNVQPYMSQSVPTLVTGTRVSVGGAVVNGAGQASDYRDIADSYEQDLIVDGLAAGATVKKGEVFSIAGIYAVNPRTKARQDFLAQFTVLLDAVANGAGQAVLHIANPIIIDGAYQTVNAAPADNAALTWMGAPNTGYRQNAVFHKSAIALTFAKLVRPRTGEVAYATDPETGVSIRYWQTSDGTNDTHLHRWDALYGVTNVDRRLGTRLSGQPAGV